ncbi:DNA sulfur modification protein DndB [Planococcus antarcticus DSM 14505]|uniref:DNA sulfur modification protein DndB n=1 Tax=Planococcus antarcticus DSM 14505 TaxID=1185653 RepID=A0AA87IJG8_9BACL|nr:DNA sulfur modification protein DndB [Planococcus antarcticus]EIM05911.1 DNA sulfur modification protein DndB [Planococcus antarcticus DSM 14505]
MSITKVNQINLGSPMATINVPALKYKSGNRIWYAITLSYRTLGKFVQTSSTKAKNRDIIKSEIRNRFLDPTHKKEIKNYITEETEFTIPPVTLVSFEPLDFRPYTFGDETQEEQEARFDAVGSIAGVLVLPIDYEFECLDGNHRTAAIRELANEASPAVADSNILLNIVYEKRERKIRQDFVDVNKNAKQTSSSINTLFNTRDKVSGLVVDLVDELDYLSDTTELLSTSVSKNSKDIYTINNIKNAVIELAGFNSQSTKVERISKFLQNNEESSIKVKEKAILFFEEWKKNEFVSKCLSDRDTTPHIRNLSLLTSGTGIIIASRAANTLLEKAMTSEEASRFLKALFDIDWSRKNILFTGNVVGQDDKILNSRDAINTVTELILEKLLKQDTETEE